MPLPESGGGPNCFWRTAVALAVLRGAGASPRGSYAFGEAGKATNARHGGVTGHYFTVIGHEVADFTPPDWTLPPGSIVPAFDFLWTPASRLIGSWSSPCLGRCVFTMACEPGPFDWQAHIERAASYIADRLTTEAA